MVVKQYLIVGFVVVFGVYFGYAEQTAEESIKELYDERYGDGGSISLLSSADFERFVVNLEHSGLGWIQKLIDDSTVGKKLDEFIAKFENEFKTLASKLGSAGIADIVSSIKEITQKILGSSDDDAKTRKRRDVTDEILKWIDGGDAFIPNLLDEPKTEYSLISPEINQVKSILIKTVEKLIKLVEKFRSLIASSPMLVIQVNLFLKKLKDVVNDVNNVQH